ncbi:MAG: hypothetical protein COZ69_09835 [Deltaproteobacteria bacterium CG_4_8_14_3_um_filter_45_9]|nr:MAG: hypothetical protein COS40_03410 [Deltaproteobacteria bacterium CG03_land_8_20_14_0_80_45_14]PIX22918.1 MAG: hypothetical protein COZ69_09835 [Deltaproteobacteria bacterium CG_4_8_14_3_um_filter_45_9]
MFLAEYLSVFTAQVDQYSRTALITSSEIKADFRTEKIGVIRGIIEFIDESKLFLTEYIDFRYKLEKLTYAYHYQDKNGQLIFRYDNAVHKPRLDFKDHKHLKDKVISCHIPELRQVLEEILSPLAK